MNKRLLIGLLLGALLGVFCIIGASVRTTESLSSSYLLSFWFNRVLIGLVIGLIFSTTPLKIRIVRGFLVGLFESFAFYSATDYYDLVGFLVGGVYGMIIEYVLFKVEIKGINK